MQPETEFAEGTAKEKEYLDLLQRTQADFMNFRRRVEREREEQGKFAKAELIVKLLPILDDFSRARETTPPEAANSEWAKGVGLIEKELLAVLEDEGTSKIEAEGKDFDPQEHEAISYEESDVYEEGKVKTVFSDGYRFNGKVLRPARVAVSKGKTEKNNLIAERSGDRRTLWQRYWA